MNSDSSLADWFSLWLDKAVKAPSLLSYDQAEWRDLEEIVLSVISDHETSDTTHYPKCHLTWMVVENFFSREWKRNHLKYRKYAVRIRKSVGRFMSPFMPVVIISFPIKLNLLISDFFFFCCCSDCFLVCIFSDNTVTVFTGGQPEHSYWSCTISTCTYTRGKCHWPLVHNCSGDEDTE